MKITERTPVAVALGLIVMLAAALRFYGIDRLPIWYDEAYALWYSQLALSDIWTTSRSFDAHPPLYYTLLKGWRVVFGDGEVALRGLPAAFGIATVPAVYLLGRIVGGTAQGVWIGLGAAVLFALSPVQIRFSQEAMPHTGIVFAVAVALCGAAWLMRNPDAARRPAFGLTSLRTATAAGHTGVRVPLAWLTLLTGMSLGLWMHLMAIFFVLAVALSAILWFVWERGRDPAYFVNGVLAGLVLLLLWLPYLPWVGLHLGHFSGDSWYPPPSPSVIAGAADFVFGVSYLWPWVLLAPLAALAAAGLWAVGRTHGWPIVILLATMMAAPFLLEIIASFAFRPLFLKRTLIWTMVPYAVALAAGVAVLPRPWMRLGALAVLAAVFLAGGAGLLAKHKNEGWDKVAAILARHAGPADLVLLVPNSVSMPLSYYLRREGRDLPYVPLPEPYPVLRPTKSDPSWIKAAPAITPEDIPAVRQRLGTAEPVWLIMRAIGTKDPQRLVFGLLRENRTLTDEWNFSGAFVYRFE